MILLAFGIGIVIGLLIRDIKCRTENAERMGEKGRSATPRGKTQFIPSVSAEEKFDGSKNIGDFVS